MQNNYNHTHRVFITYHHLLFVSVRLHGHESSGLPDAGSSHLIPMTEQEDRLSSQAGTVRLDAFTHCLVAKCGPEVTCLFCHLLGLKEMNIHS